MHPPANFLKEPVTLLHIVTSTRGDDVGPFVTAATTSRHDVIYRVRVFQAVRATVAIA
jgi:hypothetical protein